jgi:hypothetical protein
MPQAYDYLCGVKTIHVTTEIHLGAETGRGICLVSGGICRRFCIFREEIFYITVRVHL